MRQHGVRPCKSLEELFANSEVLVECEALTAHTAGIVNEAVLKLMPKGGIFVNVARGAIVDQAALDRCAREGKIRVASDVFREEPLPKDSPLRDNPNVIISILLTHDRLLSTVRRFCVEKHFPLSGRRAARRPHNLEIFDRST